MILAVILAKGVSLGSSDFRMDVLFEPNDDKGGIIGKNVYSG